MDLEREKMFDTFWHVQIFRLPVFGLPIFTVTV